MYEKELERIVKASRNNTLTFFVGAGISRVSGAPVWDELTNTICEKLALETKKSYSYEESLRIPQMFYASLEDDNKNVYYQTVESAVNKDGMLPNAVHKAMLSLNPVSFITTNYDTLLEDAAAKYGQIFKSIACDHEVPIIQGDRYILKMHGDFKNRNFVLKEEDYLNYSDHFKLIDIMLKSIFATNTVVFVGYKLNDYNIKLILNWVKELLDDDFRNPIFLYTDNEELTPLDLKYHMSKGVDVIEWQKINKAKNEFPDRYLSFFDAIKYRDAYIDNGKNDDEAFNALYLKLEPLNRLRALRHEDVSSKISKNSAIVESNGAIRMMEKSNLFTKFIRINEMNQAEKQALDEDSIKMYQTIKSVLEKASIYWIYDNKKYYPISRSVTTFADQNCIMFDYKAMDDYVSKSYEEFEDNLTKAYYLYKLCRYRESYELSQEISRRAFQNNDFLSFYLTKANCYILGKILRNSNPFVANTEEWEVDDLYGENQVEKLFDQLPVEFRYKYDSLKDIHSPTLLFRYAYNAFESAYKVDEVINSNTIEYGNSSSDRAIEKINDYMHFLQANRLMSDVFTEYKNSVKRIMEALVHKYAFQEKKRISSEQIMSFHQANIVFDEVDFNCLVDFFKANELVQLFYRNSISKIEFKDTSIIELVVNNLMDSYCQLKDKANFFAIVSIQAKIKNALVILRYMDISQDLVDEICIFILKNEFREIRINDKILFLDRQVYRRKKNSAKVTQIVEEQLLHYLDEHKKSLDEGTEFNVYSSVTGISYPNLANYLAGEGEVYISKELSKRVDALIDNDQIALFSSYYYEHIEKEVQQKLIIWMESRIVSKFDFRLLSTLFRCNYRISDSVNEQLVDFIRKDINTPEQSSNVIVFPQRGKYDNLIQVGYWCFLNLLDSSKFEEFVGISDEYDFYYLYDEFDYDKFDVRWLVGVHDDALRKIAENESVAVSIRKSIVNSILANNYTNDDNEKLHRILLDFFC